MAEQLARQEPYSADALRKNHPQLSEFPFARDAAKGHKDDEQRHQRLQHEGGRQQAEAQQHG